MYGCLAFIGAVAILGTLGSSALVLFVHAMSTPEERKKESISGWSIGEKATFMDKLLVSLFSFFLLFILWAVGCVLVYHFHVLTWLG